MISTNDRKQIIQELQDTWEEIGMDVLNGIAMEKVGMAKYFAMTDEQKWRANESASMPRADVVCCVTDNWYGSQSELAKGWHDLTDSEQASIKKEAFPYVSYGY